MEYLILGMVCLTTIVLVLGFVIIIAKLDSLSREMVRKEDLDELEDDIERSVENARLLVEKSVQSEGDIVNEILRLQKQNFNSDISGLQQQVSEALRVQSENNAHSVEQLQKGINAQLQQMTEAQGTLQKATHEQMEALRESVSKGMSDIRRESGETNAANFKTLQDGLNAQLRQMGETIGNLQRSNGEQINALRTGMNADMETLRRANQEQLAEIRKTVDEQLQDALDKKLKQSFDSVVEQLAIVQKGLGEMQTLATGVGDLKKVLSNTKTRGILGEAQLGAILEQILSPEQYETNKVTVKGSRDPVEFAVKLPGLNNELVYLPIDSKFPLETYSRLVDAYESADGDAIEAARKALCDRLLGEAKDIHEKYIHVPETTEFGVLFLPVEGLYAEAVRLGMVEKLQAKYQINIAGPTTMAAFLNSLQMGFRTLAIQKRSAEVWKVLGNVKTEFIKFEEVLNATRKKLNQANDDLEQLIGARTRKINKSLADITAAAELGAGESLPLPEEIG